MTELKMQLRALLDYYKGSKMMLAIKLNTSTRTLDRLLNDEQKEVQPLREEKITKLYNRVFPSPDPSKPEKVKA